MQKPYVGGILIVSPRWPQITSSNFHLEVMSQPPGWCDATCPLAPMGFTIEIDGNSQSVTEFMMSQPLNTTLSRHPLPNLPEFASTERILDTGVKDFLESCCKTEAQGFRELRTAVLGQFWGKQPGTSVFFLLNLQAQKALLNVTLGTQFLFSPLQMKLPQNLGKLDVHSKFSQVSLGNSLWLAFSNLDTGLKRPAVARQLKYKCKQEKDGVAKGFLKLLKHNR